MFAYVVCEGATDKALLRELLLPDFDPATVSIMSAGGKSAAESLARTILAIRRVPVALIADADTTDSQRVAEDLAYYTGSLRQAAAGVPFSVLLAVPELEICLFQDPSALEQRLQTKFSDAELVQAQFQPKSVLQTALAKRALKLDPDTMTHLLAGQELSRLRAFPLIAQLREFLREHAGQFAEQRS